MSDESDGLWARLDLVDTWYPEGSRAPIRAWVVEWLDDSGADPQTVRAALDDAPEPAHDDDAMTRLSEAAAHVARGAIPDAPAAFGHSDTDLDAGYQRVVLLGHAIQAASRRLNEAAMRDEKWSGDLVLIALTETIAWVRALDDTMRHIWNVRQQPAMDHVTDRIDSILQRDGWDPRFVAWAKSRRAESGYSDWTIGLVLWVAGVPRGELEGLRWLAGKMLHFGPLPAAELKQWRSGEPPRWKWRPSADIFPRRGRDSGNNPQRRAYDEHLAGRDLIGTFNLFDALVAAESLARDLAFREAADRAGGGVLLRFVSQRRQQRRLDAQQDLLEEAVCIRSVSLFG